MRILMTSGGTSEFIDGVRVVTNLSSGSTGACLAEHMSSAGHEVHLLHGRFAVVPERVSSVERYTDFRDLDARLKKNLQKQAFDAVIHLAAVSDFSPERIIYADGREAAASAEGKLSSSEAFSLSFVKNPKIIDAIKSYSETPLVLIGYKLTNTTDESERLDAVNGLLDRSYCDLVVHNDLHGIDEDTHKASYYSREGKAGCTVTKQEMAAWLLNYLGEKI